MARDYSPESGFRRRQTWESETPVPDFDEPPGELAQISQDLSGRQCEYPLKNKKTGSGCRAFGAFSGRFAGETLIYHYNK